MSGAIVTPRGLLRMLALTLRAPGDAARLLVGLNLSRAVLWQALALVTVVSVLVAALSPVPMPDAGPVGGAEGEVLTPFAFALVLGVVLVMVAFALHVTGAALGGTGSLAAALTLVVWLEVLAVAVRIVQGVGVLISPVLGGLVSMGGVAVLFWTLINFINALHGFGSLGKSLLTLLLAVTGISLGTAVILSLVGAGSGWGMLDV
jgi:hypothetical protein